MNGKAYWSSRDTLETMRTSPERVKENSARSTPSVATPETRIGLLLSWRFAHRTPSPTITRSSSTARIVNISLLHPNTQRAATPSPTPTIPSKSYKGKLDSQRTAGAWGKLSSWELILIAKRRDEVLGQRNRQKVRGATPKFIRKWETVEGRSNRRDLHM